MASAFDTSLDWLGRTLGVWLTREVRGEEPFVPSDAVALRPTIRPADVLLVAGGNKLSTAIKYLTQSTWSHAALYVGSAPATSVGGEHTLIEVNLGEGCVAVPLSKYDHFHTRICRPVGLIDADREAVIASWSRGSTRSMTCAISSISRAICCRPRRCRAAGVGE